MGGCGQYLGMDRWVGGWVGLYLDYLQDLHPSFCGAAAERGEHGAEAGVVRECGVGPCVEEELDGTHTAVQTSLGR